MPLTNEEHALVTCRFLRVSKAEWRAAIASEDLYTHRLTSPHQQTVLLNAFSPKVCYR